MPKIPIAITIPLTTTVDILSLPPQPLATTDDTTEDINKPIISNKSVKRSQHL